MASKVGTLYIELEARVKKVEEGLAKGVRKVQNFEKKSTSAFGKVGKTLKSLGKRFLGLGAIIAAATSAFSLASFVKESIRAASAVDGFFIRLTALTGSTEEAGKALGRLTTFAAKVAPSLESVIEAAATLGTVALGSGKKISVLTETAANIAAVTGLTLTQSAQNLQRALSAGIGAADLFRERGVRAIVEALTGIPNLIKTPLDEVEAAMLEVFGPGGVFGEAATSFSDTLPGAVSVTGDAMFQLAAAFGEAISPAVIGLLKTVVIPIFEKLKKVVDLNAGSIRSGLADGFKILGNVIQVFGTLVVSVMRVVSLAITTVKLGIAGFVNTFVQLTRLIVVGLGKIGAVSKETVNYFSELGKASNEHVLEVAEAGAEAQETLTELGADVLLVGDALKKLDTSKMAELAKLSDEAAEKLETQAQLAAAVRGADQQTLIKVAQAQRGLNAEMAKQGGILAKEGGKLQQIIVAEDTRIAKIQELLGNARLALDYAIKQHELKILANEELIKETKSAEGRNNLELANVALAARLVEHRESLATLEAQAGKATAAAEERRSKAIQGQLDQKAGIATLEGSTQSLLETLYRLDSERALVLWEQRAAMHEGEMSLDKQLETLTKIRDEAQERLKELGEMDSFGDELAQTVQSSLVGAMGDVFRGEAVDFADVFANLAGDLFEQSMMKATESLTATLGDALQSVFDNAASGLSSLFGDLGGGGGGLGDIIGGAMGSALGFGMSLLSGALQKTETSIQNDMVDTGVEQTRELRGVVAGPTAVPIFQVGKTIESAFVTTNTILREILSAIKADGDIGGAGAGTGEGAPETGPTNQLVTTSQTLG